MAALPAHFHHLTLSAAQEDQHLTDRNTHATRIAGKGADPEKKALFAAVTKRIDYSPKFGTELQGVSLAKLNDQQREELALFISERGVVWFRDQEDFDDQEHLRLGRAWGPLHVHPLIPHNQVNPEIIVLDSRLSPPGRYNSNNAWHSDVSFEPAPSSYSILKFETIPESGGDTAWANGYALYDSLEPRLQKFFETLTATHSSDTFRYIQAVTGRKSFGKFNDTEHPVVRTNPVTGWKALFPNSVFTREINGLSDSESKWILNYIYDLTARRLEFQARFKWTKNSVAIWDNRSTFHTGVPDFAPYTRTGLRVTVSGEIPFYDPNSGTQAAAWEIEKAAIVARQAAADADLKAKLALLNLENSPVAADTTAKSA